MSDVIDTIVMDHTAPAVVGGPVPVLHTETPESHEQHQPAEQPKPDQQPAQPHEQEVQVTTTVKPAEQPKPDQD